MSEFTYINAYFGAWHIGSIMCYNGRFLPTPHLLYESAYYIELGQAIEAIVRYQRRYTYGE